MAAICSVCGSFRLDARKKCRCGAIKHTFVLPALNLRCEWCKQLFVWTPKRIYQIEKFRRTCSDRCAGRLTNWEYEKRGNRQNGQRDVPAA